jgi:hypothetical protein
MPLFRHHRKEADGALAAGAIPPGFTGTIPPGFSGLAEFGAVPGWQPVPGRPFDGHLETAVHEITRARYGAPRTGSAVMQTGIQVQQRMLAHSGPAGPAGLAGPADDDDVHAG